MTDKKITNEPGANYEQDKAAEEISNAARDQVDDADQKAKDIYGSTPKTPEEQADKMGTAHASKKILEDRIKDGKKDKKNRNKLSLKLT